MTDVGSSATLSGQKSSDCGESHPLRPLGCVVASALVITALAKPLIDWAVPDKEPEMKTEKND